VPPDSSVTPARPAPSANPLGFSLSFIAGKGVLGLAGRVAGGLCACERLELEIPRLSFPFDVSGGAGRFQSRRCLLRQARLVVDEAALTAALAGSAAVAEAGFGGLAVRLRDGIIEAGGRAHVGEAEAEVTARGYFTAAGERGLRLSLAEVHVYGALPSPAVLVGRRLLEAATAGLAGARLAGAADLVLDPLGEVLFALLPRAGWRLPDVSRAVLTDVRVADGRLELCYRAGAPGWAAPALERWHAHREGTRRFAALEEQLPRGAAWEARAAYQRAFAEAAHPLLRERLLDLLAAGGAGTAEAALAAAGAALAQDPDDWSAHLAQAAALLGRGQPFNAAVIYAALAERAAAAGATADVAAAGRAAARLFRDTAPERATPALERVAAVCPDDEEVAALLAERYEAEARRDDQAALLRRRIGAAPAPAAQAALLAELARILRRSDDDAGAAAALARAAELAPGDPALWEALAEAHAASGDAAQAAASLGQAALLFAARGDTEREAALQARRAAACERAGALGEAARAYARDLELRPDDAASWRHAAEIAERSWRPADAMQALRRHLELCDSAEERRRSLRDLGRLAFAEGDLKAAAAALEEALALAPDDGEALRLLVDVAAARGNPVELEAALARAALATDGAARAELLRRRAEVLWHELGRDAEAVVALEQAVAAAPADAAPALRMLAELQQGRGDEGAVRDALARLLPLSGEAPDYPELATRAGELAARAGDRDAARALLRAAADRAADPRRALGLLEGLLAREGDLAERAALLGRRVEVEERRGEPGPLAAALRAHAAALTELGRHADAAAALERALGLEPADLATVHALAGARLAVGELGPAEALYRRWLTEAPGAPPAERAAVALRLGELCDRQGRDREAVDCFRTALAAGARGDEAIRCWRRVVASLQRRGEHEAAAEALAAAAADEATGEAPPERAAHLAVAAEIWRTRLGDPARARDCLDRALALAPDCMRALDGLEALETAAGTPAAIATVLERKVAASARSPARAKALLARLAELHAGPLGQLEAARDAMSRALALDPDFRPARLWLARDALARGDRATAEEHYRAIAAQPPPADDDPRRRDELTEALARLAGLCRDAGRIAEAERLCGRALDAQPRCVPALTLLDDLLGDQGRHAEQCEVLRRHAALLLEGTEPGAVARALALELRRARLLEEELSNPREAAAAYRHVLRLDPAHREALERLAGILRRERSPRELFACLSRLVALGPPEAAVARHLEMAAVARDGLGEPETATAHFRLALGLDPRSTAALDGLIGLTRGRGDPAALDELLARRIELAGGPARAAALTLERAQLLAAERRSGDALALLRELAVEELPDEGLRLRADLCEAAGAHGEAATALEVLRGRSRGRGDAPTELIVVRRLATLAGALGHDRAAEELLRRCLELAPDDEPAARGLAELYRRQRDGRRYVLTLERLLGAMRRRGAPPAEELDLVLEIAGVLLSGGDARGARMRLDEALAVAPEDRRVRRLRAEAAAALGEFTTVRDDLRALAAAEGLQPAARADLFAELGEVCGERLGDGAAALAALEQAAALYPPGLRRQSTLRQLAERAFRAGDHARAAAAYGALEARAPEDQARLAEALERTGRSDAAAALWRELEEVAPLRARARARLCAIYRAAGQEHELAAALERAAGDEGEGADPRSRAAALNEAAALYLAAGDRPAATRCATAALGADRGAPDLAPLLRAVGEDLPAAAALLRELAPTLEPPRRVVLFGALAAAAEQQGDAAVAAAALAAALADEQDPARRAALLLDRARLERDALGDAAAAAVTLEAVLAIDPEARPALAAAAELAERRGDLARAEELLARLASLGEAAERRRALDRMSQLALRRGDEPAFTRHLEAILELEPGDERALAGLASLRKAQGDAHGAAELTRRLAERARTPQRRAELWTARAALLDRAGDPDGAAAALEQAAAEEPDAAVLERLTELWARRERFVEAAAACARLCEALPEADGARRGEAWARLGGLRLRLADAPGARAAFARAAADLRAGPAWAAALRRVAELDLAAGDAAGARAALGELCATGDATEADRGRLAGLAPRGEDEENRRQETGNRQPATGNGPVQGRAGAEEREGPEELTDEARLTVRALEEETKPHATVAYLRRRIEVAAEQGNEGELTLFCRELWARLPGDALAFAHLRRLAAAHDPEELTAVLAGRIDASDQPGERAALRCELATLLEERHADAEVLASLYEQALADDPGSTPALEALADLCYRRHDLSRARELYALLGDRAARLTFDALAYRRGGARAAAAAAPGELAEAQLFYAAAAERNPAHLECREALARLALLAGDRAAAMQWLRHVDKLLPLTEVERRLAVRKQLAELHVRAGQPGVARVYLELVLAENQDCAPALELAATVYAQLGDWERSAQALERLGYIVEDAQMRAELLFRRGEIYRRRLGQAERASDCYLRAIDLAPHHVPTLRRVVDHYWSQGDWPSVVEVGAELAQLGPPVSDAGFAIRFSLATVLATRDLATAAARLGRVALDAELLRDHLAHVARCLARAGAAVEQLDGPLALFTTAGGERLAETLAEELAHHLAAQPADAACRRLLGRLQEQRGAVLRARGHYAVCAFVDPADPAAARLAALGPAPEARGEALQRGVHPDARGPLRRVLGVLAPALAGLAPEVPRPAAAPIEAQSAPLPFAHIEQLRVALGLGALRAGWIPDEPLTATAEATRPPQLLLSRSAAALPPAEFGFVVARALDLVRSGGAVISRLGDEEVAALLSALAAQFGDPAPLVSEAARAFADRLATSGVRPDAVVESLRAQVAADLRACLTAPSDLAAFRHGQLRSAERVALLACGDALAALRALARLEGARADETPQGRAALLERAPALTALIDFATGPEYEAALA
jgi:tetratricopeptide (TPR) repeat protein